MNGTGTIPSTFSAAISSVNGSAGANSITFSGPTGTTVTESGNVIAITNPAATTITGDPNLTVTINGGGNDILNVSAAQRLR